MRKDTRVCAIYSEPLYWKGVHTKRPFLLAPEKSWCSSTNQASKGSPLRSACRSFLACRACSTARIWDDVNHKRFQRFLWVTEAYQRKRAWHGSSFWFVSGYGAALWSYYNPFIADRMQSTVISMTPPPSSPSWKCSSIIMHEGTLIGRFFHAQRSAANDELPWRETTNWMATSYNNTTVHWFNNAFKTACSRFRLVFQ